MHKFRVLLALEDYQEQTDLHALFTKCGWDVKIVKREILVKDEIFAFNPDLLISGGKGRQINGMRLASSLQRKGGRPRLLLHLEGKEAKAEKLRGVPIDGVLDKALDSLATLQFICQLCGLDEKPVIEKYRLRSTEVVAEEETTVMVSGKVDVPSESIHVKGGASVQHSEQEAPPPAPSAEPPPQPKARDWIFDERRKALYDKLVASVDGNALNEWNLEEVKKTSQDLQASRSPEDADLDQERKDFVRALFKQEG